MGGRRTWQLCVVAVAALEICGIASGQSSEPSWGGTHEFGVAGGFSPHGGPIWGFSQNVKYVSAVARYSYPIFSRGSFTLRYAPEVTLLSRLHENGPSTINPAAPVTHDGAGLSPEGFQLVFRNGRRVQPFGTNAGGFIYFGDRVLSPQGSQFMYTIDFGAGVNLFIRRRTAVQVGFKYQHLSNANISMHNPGTDAQTFFVGVSHFHTRQSRRQ